MNRKVKEMIGGCCVCSDERGWSENPLVYCDGTGCTVAVHQACYGIVQVPTGPWFCKKCESQERVVRVRCELCPQRDGALKRTNSGGWCHVVCALYIPEAWFANVQTMEPIVLTSVPSDRFNKTCYICEEQKRDTKATAGACMQCNRNGCKQYFHVTCAQAQGLLCEVTGSSENVKYCGYCTYHYKKLKNLSNVKTIPAFRPISNGNDTPDSSPEKNPPSLTLEETVKKDDHSVDKDAKSPQVDQSVSSTSDSVQAQHSTNKPEPPPLPLVRTYSDISDVSSAVSPTESTPTPVDQAQEPTSSIGPPPSNSQLMQTEAPTSTEISSNIDVTTVPIAAEKIEEEKKKLERKGAAKDNAGLTTSINSHSKRTRNGDKNGKSAPNKKSKSNVSSSSGHSKGDGKKTAQHASGSSQRSSSHSKKDVRSSLPGHHDYCGNVFGGGPFFQGLELPTHIGMPSISSSKADDGPSKYMHPPKIFPMDQKYHSSTNNNHCIPLTMEQMLEQQWDQGAQFLMEQGDHFDISSLLNCLHHLKRENQQTEEQVQELCSRRDRLLAVNARLTLPLSMLDSTPAHTKSLSMASLDDQQSHSGEASAVKSTAPLPSVLNQVKDANSGNSLPCTYLYSYQDTSKPAPSQSFITATTSTSAASKDERSTSSSDKTSQPPTLMFSGFFPPPVTICMENPVISKPSTSSSLSSSSSQSSSSISTMPSLLPSYLTSVTMPLPSQDKTPTFYPSSTHQDSTTIPRLELQGGPAATQSKDNVT